MMRLFKLYHGQSKKRLSSSLSPLPFSTTRQFIHTARFLSESPSKVPELNYFIDLKIQEDKQTHPSHRKRFEYDKNHTAALALPLSDDELSKKQRNHKTLFSISQANVIEHANRRVDLFFYTLIAYYKTEFFPTQGHTNLQYGIGRNTTKKNLLQACHSSIIPSFVDATIYQPNSAATKKKSILCGTHFMDSLNATVELPASVNDLDGILENNYACREKSLDIIRRVALGQINPIEGLNGFLKMMRDVLKHIEQQTNKNTPSTHVHHSFLKSKSINSKLIHLIKKGTLEKTFSEETESVLDSYIQLLLRINPKKNEKLTLDDNTKKQLYLTKMAEIQDEILNTKGRHALTQSPNKNR